MATKLYQPYLDIPFCDVSSSFKEKIGTLFEDIENF